MDEMRDRYRVPRRDYSDPVRRAAVRPAVRPGHTAPVTVAPAPVTAAPAHHKHPQPSPPAPRYMPAARPAAPAHPRHHTKKGRFKKSLIFLVILALLAGGGFFAYWKYYVKNPFPADIRQSAGVDLLYPGQLPAGYKIDPASFQNTNGILIYDADNGDQRLVFTIQKTPGGFDFSSFYKQQFQSIQQISTPFGQASIGINSSRYLGSLNDGDTWLLLSTNSSTVSRDDMSMVMTHLKRY